MNGPKICGLADPVPLNLHLLNLKSTIKLCARPHDMPALVRRSPAPAHTPYACGTQRTMNIHEQQAAARSLALVMIMVSSI